MEATRQVCRSKWFCQSRKDRSTPNLFGMFLVAVVGFIFPVDRPAADGMESVSLRIRGTVTELDDYLCWPAVLGEARLTTDRENNQRVTVSAVSPKTGQVAFQSADEGLPHLGNREPTESIELSLPADKTWVRFYVMGTAPSNGHKDVQIVAKDMSGDVLGTKNVMVRVRKNAESLTPREIETFLSALRTLHDIDGGFKNSRYDFYVRAHADGSGYGLHAALAGNPLFLVWHRALLLDFERALQAIDPRVAVPYWRFDRPTEQLFTQAFMGDVSDDLGSHGFIVTWNDDNPINRWSVDTISGPLLRGKDGTNSAIRPDMLDIIFGNESLSAYARVNPTLQRSYHDVAHAYIAGWLSLPSSPADPLFFLLHANVDRAWALWQNLHGLHDASVHGAYAESALGTYPGPSVAGRLRKGTYVDDVMWPWFDPAHSAATTDELDDWPAIWHAFPQVEIRDRKPITPTPEAMIDYLDIAGNDAAHDVCYDDVVYPELRVPE